MLGSGAAGSGGGDGAPMSGLMHRDSCSVLPSLSGDSRDSPLKRECFSDLTGIFRVFRRNMHSLLKSLLTRLICSICVNKEKNYK